MQIRGSAYKVVLPEVSVKSPEFFALEILPLRCYADKQMSEGKGSG
jgi:hypothetical protein